MTMEERRATEKEVERILDNIVETETEIEEYKEMLYKNRDEIDTTGCARWLVTLRYNLAAYYDDLERYLADIY